MGNCNCFDKKYQPREDAVVEQHPQTAPVEQVDPPIGFIFGPEMRQYDFRPEPRYYKETRGRSIHGMDATEIDKSSAAAMIPPDTVESDKKKAAVAKANREMDFTMVDRGTDR